MSEKVKVILDRLEPGVHTFIPFGVSIHNGDGTIFDYYLLNLTQAIDAVIRSETRLNVGFGHEPGFEIPPSLSQMGDCTLDGTLIAGKHLWRGSIRPIPPPAVLTPFCNQYFCSDELVHELMNNVNAKRYHFIRCIVK